MKIGDLAKRADCQVVTVRYYEKEGLLSPPKRTEGNYRVYDASDVERLKFIRHCRKHHMTLADIRQLLSFRDQKMGDCAWVGDLIDAHIASVERQIQSLLSLKTTLETLRSRCKTDGDTCGIVASLADSQACGCDASQQAIFPIFAPGAGG